MGNRCQCPHCGGALVIKGDEHPLAQILTGRSRSASKTYAMAPQRFVGTGADDLTRVEETRQLPDSESVTVPLATPGTYRESEEKTPIHAPSLRSQWAPALAKALTVWTGTSALVFATIAGYTDWTRPGLSAFLIGGIPGAYQWTSDQEFFKDALYQIKNFTEEILQADLDGDGSIGEPEPVQRPEPGTVIINGRQHPQESEASRKRRAMVGLAEIVWRRQNSNLPTGVKALLEGGDRLPGGYKIGYDLHKELGNCLIQAGYAESKKVGQNETWRFLDDVLLDEIESVFGVWDD